jgi:UDP-N-acetylmuramyl pentapeptide phosphotransferase/UDP-N-acetylglucosamine-1-phosphate transferase
MSYAISIASLFAAVAWHVAVVHLAPRLRLVKPNFNRKPVLASYGIVAFGYMAAVVCSLAVLGYAHWGGVKLYLSVTGAMWALGALDDLFGNREIGGFKGHFRKLLREGKLTTGAVKAIGGGIVGIAAGWSVYPDDAWKLIGTALMIPLAANTLNLLDLRPGRAVAGFFLGLAVTYIVARGSLFEGWLVVGIALVTLACGIVDSRGRAMMGDSGANALGAALGLTIALDAPILIVPAVALLAVIHVYSEKNSISDLIERNRVLRVIDRRLGVR